MSMTVITNLGQAGRTLPEADALARLIGVQVAAGYEISASKAVQVANGQIQPQQRYYDVELKQAADLLGVHYPKAATRDAWYFALKNNMGYRLVEMPICSYGQVIDRVTRSCVAPSKQTPKVEPKPPEPSLPAEPKPSLQKYLR